MDLSIDFPQACSGARSASAGAGDPSSSGWRAAMGRWLSRQRDRDAMAGMTLRDMRDAGITPYDVGHECAKPFWRA